MAGLAGDPDRVRAAAIGAGFVGQAAADRHRAAVDRMIAVIVAEMNRAGAVRLRRPRLRRRAAR